MLLQRLHIGPQRWHIGSWREASAALAKGRCCLGEKQVLPHGIWVRSNVITHEQSRAMKEMTKPWKGAEKDGERLHASYSHRGSGQLGAGTKRKRSTRGLPSCWTAATWDRRDIKLPCGLPVWRLILHITRWTGQSRLPLNGLLLHVCGRAHLVLI